MNPIIISDANRTGGVSLSPVQGSSGISLQGSGGSLQGSGSTIQGSSPTLSSTSDPMNYSGGEILGYTSGASTTAPAPAPVYTGPSLAVLNPLFAALDAVGGAFDTAKGSAKSDYENIMRQYDERLAVDKQRYGEQVTQNEQNLTGDRQAALLQASQGGQGLRAVLAAMGALNGTGSLLADRAISQAANKDIGDAQDSFETNATNLQGAWADTEAEDKQRRTQAEQALQAANNAARTSYLNNRIDIYGKLANAYGEGTAEATDYANRAASLYADVAKIPQGQAVGYTPVSSLYSPQALANYLAGTNSLQVQAQTGNSQPGAPNVIATPTPKRKDELS